MSENLNPDKALIFRIVHRSNIPWILDNGMYCRNADIQAPDYQTIGNHELIEKIYHAPKMTYQVQNKQKIISWMRITHPKILDRMRDGLTEMFI